MNQDIFSTWKISTLIYGFSNVVKRPKKSPKTDAKKTGPFKDRKGEDQDRPKTENCRTGTSLVRNALHTRYVLTLNEIM